MFVAQPASERFMRQKLTINADRQVDRITPTSPAVFADPASCDTLLEIVINSLESSSAIDVDIIEISGKSALADHMVVASGRSHRHVGAISDHLQRALKTAGCGTARTEGLPACDWVLVDTADVICHIFRPEIREFYNIEKMWRMPDLPA